MKKNKEQNKKNKYSLYNGFVPKWLFYTALVIVIGGIVKGLSHEQLQKNIIL